MTVASYFLPRSKAEALDLLARHGPELLVVAGGTVAMPLINDGISLPEVVMGLRRAGLDGLERRDGTLRIGAAATLTQLAGQDAVPLLRDAAREHGQLVGPEHGARSAATCSPHRPAATSPSRCSPRRRGDASPVPSGERTMPLAEFFTGFLTNRLADDELLVEILVPDPAGATAFVKFGRKHANTPAVVTVAVALPGTGTGRRRPDRARRRRAASHPRPRGRAAPGRDEPRRRDASPPRPPAPPTSRSRSPTRSPASGIAVG